MRTVLQELNSDMLKSSSYIASVTTLGTPHSGIADEDKLMHEISFPQGQDGIDVFEVAGQISTHQMGEKDSFVSNNYNIFGVEAAEGGFAAKLNNTTSNIPVSTPIQVAIGLTAIRGDNSEVDDGDGLISYEGQRWSPSLGTAISLLDHSTLFGGSVTETILGFSDDIKPGSTNPDENFDGYQHSTGTWLDLHPDIAYENKVECSSAASCNHASFKKVEDWLTIYRQTNSTNVPLFNLNIQVVDSESKAPLNGAKVTIIANETCLKTIGDQHTFNNGTAQLLVPFFPNTKYTARIDLEGYRSMVADNNFVSGASTAQTSAEFGKVNLQKNVIGYGDLGGRIVDATTGAPIVGVYYELYKDSRRVSSGFTSSSGYMIYDLVRGTYTLKLSNEGYLDATYVFSVSPNVTNVGNCSMRRELASGQMSIVLTWDLNPRDLDSHLFKYNSSGSQLYHIAYYHKVDSATGDNLDRDDVTSYGPETVTIQSVDPSARYVYSVYHYSGSGSIFTSSNAVVTINYGNSEPIILRAPSSGSGRWWNVFEIVNGEILPFNASTLIQATIDADSIQSIDLQNEPEGIDYTLEMPPKEVTQQ